MKALGVGLGAFPFADVEVVRHGLDAPSLVLHGSALAPGPAGRGGAVAPLPHPHRPGGHGPGGGRGPAGGRPGPDGDPRPRAARRSRSVMPMLPVLTVSEMNAVDAAALASTPLEVLVARAGLAVALAALDLLGGAYGRRVVVVAGRGNNGADGRVAAPPPAPPGGPGPRGRGRDRATAVGSGRPGHRRRLRHRVPGRVPRARSWPRGPRCWPSTSPRGWRATPGRRPAPRAAAWRTVTFVALKPGLLQGDGARLAGRVSVVDIGLPAGPARPSR